MGEEKANQTKIKGPNELEKDAFIYVFIYICLIMLENIKKQKENTEIVSYQEDCEIRHI